MKNTLSLDRIYQAAFALKDAARKTDLIYSPHFSGKNQVYFKTENLQVTGSFKLRGAYFKISRLSDEEKAAGIVACSAGNHAQGVALAAQRMGIKATICMPDGAPISKVEATKSYGADVVLVKGAYDDAYQYALKLQEEEHATFIHPFDDPDVIAGQGTIGLEILDQLKDVDVLVVPVGGGGLISGVAFAAKRLKPGIKIYGVQAKEAASMADSLKYCKAPGRPDVRPHKEVCGRRGHRNRRRDSRSHPGSYRKAEADRGGRRSRVGRGSYVGQDT